MAYPFGPLPTLGAFIHVACTEYAAELKPLSLVDPSGARKQGGYLVRKKADGKKCIAALPALRAEQHLFHDTLRSLCVQLEIPPARFGLTLD